MNDGGPDDLDMCLFLAATAWPNEAPALRHEWAPKIKTDPEIGRRTLRRARANAHPDRNDGQSIKRRRVEDAARTLGLI